MLGHIHPIFIQKTKGLIYMIYIGTLQYVG